MADVNTAATGEDQLRELVATVNRILYMEGQLEFSGHVSIRDPETDVVYMNTLSQPRGEVRPEDVVPVSLDSEPLDPDAPDPVGEREIHTAVYREHDDINAVLHTHAQNLTLFAIADAELLPVTQRGTNLADGPVPLFEREGKITTKEESAAMVDAMDGQKQLLLKNHGAVVCDETMERAVVRAINLDRNAGWQRRASDLGEINEIPESEIDRINEGNWKETSIAKMWRFVQWKANRDGYLPDSW